ncbi:MAG: hypothetical protein KC729_20070, partial [Candidatus Eisenbacteria bacterium]|nr:hypothetical protein [Candidatus Eisenbacteria bacterium]
MTDFTPFDDPSGPLTGSFDDIARIVPVAAGGDGPFRERDLVSIDTIHDGPCIPVELGPLSPAARHAFEHAYSDERDWGAHYVADSVSRHLGLEGYLRVQLARPLLDFGRFAGIHETAIDPTMRYAISPPMARHLDDRQKRLLLERGYDEIFQALARWIEGKRIKLAIHTYRPSNEIGTRRPEVSLLLRSPSYDQNTDLRQTTFFELYPRDLVEFTADRILAYRMAMTLEQAFIPTGINSPYLLPDGAVEIRLQVWSFFHFVKRRLEEEGASTGIGSPEYEAVWRMLLNTNR